MRPRLGIMQGRLTPPVRGIQAFPRSNWHDEFALAAQAGLDFIEWIFDEYGADVNPLMTTSGIAAIHAASDASGVAVDSICADYFMDWPLFKCSAAEHAVRLAMLNKLMQQGKQLGIKRIVLPFVDASSLANSREEERFIDCMLSVALPLAEEMNIEIHMETDQSPGKVAVMLEQIQHPLFWINYDSGNSASLGYKPAEEFAAYGKRIGSFHIKDRVRGGSTVPLGAGDTDFVALAKSLREVNYTRSFVLQVARCKAENEEVAWAITNSQFAQQHIFAWL